MKNRDDYSVNPDLVERQLQKILSSDGFRNSQVLSAFLKFVVEEMLAGRSNEIKEYTIGVKALGRPADFSTGIDAVVRIHAGRLRRLISEYYRTEGINDDISLEIPKGAYIPVFKQRLPVEAQTNYPAVKNDNEKDNFQRKVTLAVFPFQNRSRDNSNDNFIDSLAEQLCIDFAKFQHLSVISYYSMRRAAMEKKDIKDISKLYDVDYILTGSVRFSENVVQVNIQFLLAESGTLIWTQTYVQKYNSTNFYTIQDEIIEQVINRVADIDGIITRNIINGPLSSRKETFGAYYAVYQYYGFRGKYDLESYQQARTALEEGISTDPKNALIWSLLAKLFLSNHIFQIEAGAGDLKKGGDCAEKALWLDQNCQHAYKALAWVYLLTGRKDDCLEAIERCLGLNPKALSVVGSMGFLLICLGKYSQGFQLLLKSMHLNPVLAWYVGIGFALYYYNNRDYTESLGWIQRTQIPDIPLKSVIAIAAYSKMNNQQKDKPDQLDPQETWGIIGQPGPVLKQYIYEEELRKDLAEGLVLAGLKVY